MLQCCENPKIKILADGNFQCQSCGFNDFDGRMYTEDSQITGFSSAAYRHNENLWSAGVYPMDNRKDVYQCASCKRLYTDETTCCCGSESLAKVIDASFIKYLNRWKRVEHRIEERNEEIRNQPHDCEKYRKEYKTESRYYNYETKKYIPLIHYECAWCGKIKNENENNWR